MEKEVLSFVKCGLRLVILLLASVLVATCAMLVVFMMPTDRVKSHLLESEAYSMTEAEREINGYAYLDDKQDVTASGIMLHEAIYEDDSESLLTKAMLVSKYYVTDPEKIFFLNVSDLYRQIKGDEEVPAYKQTYARYWHGYLLPIKFLMEFLNLEELLKLNGFLILSLLAIYTFLICETKEKRIPLIAASLGFLILMNPFTIAKSLQLADIFYIMMISMILILWIYLKKVDEKLLLYVFFFNGIAVAFFDFLTYPLVAWGVPMLLVTFLYQKDTKTGLLQTIKYGLVWIFAYGGMWGAKIILATLFTDENILEDATNQVNLHTTASGEWFGEPINLGNALSHNISNATSIPMLLMYVLLVIFIIAYILKNRKYVYNKNSFMCLTLITLSPFAWYVVMVHHSFLHAYMTYRELGICVFGIILLLGNSGVKQNVENVNENLAGGNK